MGNPGAGIQCQICRNHYQINEVINSGLVEKPVMEQIQQEHPDWLPGGVHLPC